MRGNLRNGLQDATAQANLLDASLRRVGVAVGGMLTISQATQFIQTMIKVRSEVQDLSTSFEVLIGNSGQAQQMFSEIARYAIDTPMLLGDLAKGAQTLLAFNMDAELVVPTLKQIGDISMGNAEKFNSLTLAFAQMQSTGKLMGQDLLQMINAGFNPLSVMAEKTGKSIGQLKEEMSAGAISSEMVAQAFADATAEGGKFHGMMEKMSKNTSGLISNFEGAVEEMLNKMGKSQEGLINSAVSMATTLVQNYEEVGKALTSLILVYGAYKATLIATTALQSFKSFADSIRLVAMFRNELGLATAMQQAFNLTCAANPYIALGMGIAALTAIVWNYSKANSAVADEQERVNERERQQAEEIENTRTSIEDKLRVLEDEVATEGERQQAFEDLQKIMPNVFGQYRTEKELLDDITNARRNSNAELVREKQLKGEGNYEADKKSLEEMRKLRAYATKFSGETYASISQKWGDKGKLEYAEYHSLKRKYDAEIRESKGTFESYVSAIDERISARERQTNQGAEQARHAAHGAFIGRVGGMDKNTLLREQNYLKSLLEQLRGSSKQWLTISGEAAPVNEAELKSRLQTVTNRLTEIQTDASRDYVADATKAWRTAQQNLANVVKNRNNRSLYPTESEYLTAYRKAQEDEKKAKAKVESLGGSTKDPKKKGSKKTTGLTPEEKANIARAEKEEAEYRIAEQKQAQEAAQKRAEFELRASAIARTSDTAERQRKQNALEFDRVMEENRLRKLAWIAELQKLSDMEFEASNPDWKKQGKRRPIVKEDDLSADQKQLLARYEEEAKQKKLTDDASLYKELLVKYRTFEQQKDDVRKAFDKERAELAKAVDENGNKLSAEALALAYEELAKKEKEALKAISDTQLSTLEKDNSLLISLFEDSSRKSIQEIEAIIKKVRLLMDYLRAMKNEQGDAIFKDKRGNIKRTITQEQMAKLGFTPEQLRTIASSPEKIKALSDALQNLQNKAKASNPFKEFVDNIKESIDKLKNGDLAGGVAGIGSAVSAFAPIAKEASGYLAQIFDKGNEEGGGMADELGTIIDVVANLGKVAEGIFSGNPLAVIQGVGSLFAMANQSAERHRKALQAIMNEKIAQQRAYNLLLLEQNLEYERAVTIFGTNGYAKATNAVQVMKQAYASLKEEIRGTAEQKRMFEKLPMTGNSFIDLMRKRHNAMFSQFKVDYAGLASIQVKTGHKRTGIFGWGKGKDLYSSLLDVYPKLIKANGDFDVSLAKTILSSRDLKDQGKEALQAMINLAEKAEEAWKSVTDYFTDIFGDLGTSLSDTLRDAFRQGTDAAQGFAQSVEKMLATLAQQMIYSVTLAPILEKAQEQMLSITKDDGKTNEQKFASYVAILDDLTADALAQQGTYSALMAKYDAMAKARGLNLASSTATEQQGQSTALQSVTQDSITRVEGLINAILLHNIQTEGQVENIAGQLSGMVVYLRKIEVNTASSSETLSAVRAVMEEVRNDIATLRRDGIKTL